MATIGAWSGSLVSRSATAKSKKGPQSRTPHATVSPIGHPSTNVGAGRPDWHAMIPSASTPNAAIPRTEAIILDTSA